MSNQTDTQAKPGKNSPKSKTAEEYDAIRRAKKAHQHGTRGGARTNTSGSDLMTQLRQDRINKEITLRNTRLVFHRTGPQINKIATKWSWSLELRAAAVNYLRYLVFGEHSIEEAFNGLSDDDRGRVERFMDSNFALTCWMQRKIIGELDLPGMDLPQYHRLYLDAQKKFPASTPVLASS